ncbi:MAG: lipopolysaccharide heptosyltransferase I [Candidatus Nitronauta litoralis]|uniref:Lipopolysaccharide heptosyltransferase 1 n=1 Tax=Candidatus Nitronauta litoralis TaxID=2705533 RepID=A0A7T0BXE4_9BACT|nr:MAG: lipopolysaccharide heptosyltransferase I [Candidatus Nitronauta litoralis]
MHPTFEKILIVKLSSLGDIAHSLPVLCSLRKNYPKAHIAWAVESKFSDFLENHPDLDEIIEVQTQKWRRHWTPSSFMEAWGLIKSIRETEFDLVIDLQGLIKSSLITGFSGVAKRLGFQKNDCREPLSAWATNIKAPGTGHIPHIIDKNMALLEPLGVFREEPRFRVTTCKEASLYIEQQLAPTLKGETTKPVALHAGVGYPTKAWPLERFAALADHIHREFDAPILLTWGPQDRDRAEGIGKLMKEPFALAPETASLQHALALYQKLRLFICGDTGPLHLCVALNIPTVSIYGPTDPARNGPYGPIHEVLVKPQECSFCFKRTCPTEMECMKAVEVEDMLTAVRRRLQLAAGASTSGLTEGDIYGT